MLRPRTAIRKHLMSCMIAVTMLFATTPTAIFASEAPATQATVAQDLPPGVAPLFAWPSSELLDGDRRVNGDGTPIIARAKKRSVEWIKRVIRKPWLPQEADYLADNLIMIQNEYGKLDATHVRWSHGGYQIEVTQTLSVIAIKLTPTDMDGVGVPETGTAKMEYARGLCSKLLNDYEDIRRNPNKEPVRTQVLPKTLAGAFDRARLSDTPTILHGRRDCLSRRPEDAKDQEQAEQWKWDNLEAHQWWWGNVSWWTDGRAIGVYMLKASHKKWLPHYGDVDGLAGWWFEGDPAYRQPPRSWVPPEQFEPMRPGK